MILSRRSLKLLLSFDEGIKMNSDRNYIIDRLNRDESMSELLNPVKKIHDFVDKVREQK